MFPRALEHFNVCVRKCVCIPATHLNMLPNSYSQQENTISIPNLPYIVWCISFHFNVYYNINKQKFYVLVSMLILFDYDNAQYWAQTHTHTYYNTHAFELELLNDAMENAFHPQTEHHPLPTLHTHTSNAHEETTLNFKLATFAHGAFCVYTTNKKVVCNDVALSRMSYTSQQSNTFPHYTICDAYSANEKL